MSAIRFLVILSVSIITCPAQTDPPVLSEMVSAWPWGNRFTLEGDLNGVYVIEASTNLVEWEAITTNAYPDAKRQIFADFLGKPKRFFRAWRLPQPIFRHALGSFGIIRFGREGLTVDSFDSADPAFSADGQYDPLKRKDGGDVVTIGNSYLNIGNAKVMGHVAPGDAVTIGPNGAVGSKAWVEANTGIEPGWAVDYRQLDLYRVVAPFTNAAPPTNGTVGGITYTYILESGNYLLPSLNFASADKMRVTGPSVLYVQGDVLIASGGRIEIDARASLKLYVGGYSTTISSSSIINKTGKAIGFQYFGLPQNGYLRLSRDPSINGITYPPLIGVICAPHATLYASYSSGDIFHFVGALVTEDAEIYGPFHLHFDESLLRDGPWR